MEARNAALAEANSRLASQLADKAEEMTRLRRAVDSLFAGQEMRESESPTAAPTATTAGDSDGGDGGDNGDHDGNGHGGSRERGDGGEDGDGEIGVGAEGEVKSTDNPTSGDHDDRR
jgi:hypothetical protein